jgi:hypothetical protein
MTMKRSLPLLAAGLLVLAPLAASAEDLVVIDSTLPTFAPGSSVKGDQTVKLPERSRLVLVAESGRTVTLNGPYEGKPAPEKGKGGDSRLGTALASLVRSTQEDANSVGAIRAAGIRTRADALMINLSESGDYCVVDPAAVQITRYADERGAEITLNAVKGDLKTAFAWPGAGNHLAWPAALPIEDGATYLVEQAGKDSRTMLVLHKVEDKAPTDAHRAVEMAEKGCLEQAKMLLALLRKG